MVRIWSACGTNGERSLRRRRDTGPWLRCGARTARRRSRRARTGVAGHQRATVCACIRWPAWRAWRGCVKWLSTHGHSSTWAVRRRWRWCPAVRLAHEARIAHRCGGGETKAGGPSSRRA
eukprot:925161-Pleurochrysis_carterae.AAC.1